MQKEENADALKHLYNQDLLKRIALSLAEAKPGFPQKSLLQIFPKMRELEMKDRVRLIRDELHRQLPAEFPQALEILLASLKTGHLRSFDLWPYTEYVQTYGLDHREISLQALKEMTRLFTSEWAVRPFIRRHRKESLGFLARCAADPDVHIRRWASEGSRPRLPWGERLQDLIRDPSPVRPILEKLKFDPELYVRKSVANHLNDISKDHPEWVFDLLTEWQKKAGPRHADKIQWIIRHALRTAIKAGHPRALKLIGVSSQVEVQLRNLRLEKKEICMGQPLCFSFEIQSTGKKPQKLVVDYILHFRKAKGQTTPKVFKLKTCVLPNGEKLSFSRKHPVKKITTRVYYPGAQSLSIQVNGQIFAKLHWVLKF